MEEVFARYLGPKQILEPTPTQVGLGHGEEALLDRVEEMVKTTIQSELRNHHRGASPDSADKAQTSATATLNNTPET